MEAWRKELYHTGIPGMRWGVRNGPPYPLGIKDMSASEKRAHENKKRGLSAGQKRAIAIGVGTAAGLIATYAGYKLYKKYTLDKMIKAGVDYVKDNPLVERKVGNLGGSDILKFSLRSKFDKLSGDISFRELAKGINPTHRQDNCKEASFALAIGDMHKLNICVTDKRPFKGNLHDFVGHYCEGDPDELVHQITADSTNARQRLEKQIMKRFEQGRIKEGDVGAVGLEFAEKYLNPDRTDRDLTGHVFSWKLQNGQIIYEDSQGDKNGNLKDPVRLFRLINPEKMIEWVNYGEAKPREDRLAEIIKNRT